jgi:hypothetical protein
MPTDAHATALRSRTWWLVHVLAILGAFATVFLIGCDVFWAIADKPPQILNVPAAIRWLVGLGMFAVFWLWIRMLVDFFALRPVRFPVLWGFALVLGSVLGAQLYFWLVWRPRNAFRDT